MAYTSTGGRPASAAALAARTLHLDQGRSVSRKELAQAAREAARALELRPPLRMVLQELAGCWGEQDVEGRLLVWPSNARLTERTGLSERAVRYALRGLIELCLIAPRDSANGKRYAVRQDGIVVDAFGFDLTPLYARRGEFLELITVVEAGRERLRRQYDEITIHRRAVQELLAGLAARGEDTGDLAETFDALAQRTPRRGRDVDLSTLLDQWRTLRADAEKRFHDTGDGGTPCRHNETDNGSASESCNKAFRIESGELETVAPILGEFGYRIESERDLVGAGRQLRSLIGAHESAWREACELLGPVRAALAVILVLQLHDDDAREGTGRIRNPGGYFRAMARMIFEGRVSLDRELEALKRKRRA